MKTVLFEIQHLYYFPQFIPVIDELLNREDYLVYVSISTRESLPNDNILMSLNNRNAVKVISADTEDQRITACRDLEPDILIIGNVGKVNKIASKNTMTVMVYHGIGLKSSYYKDSDRDIDLYAIETEERIGNMLKHGIDREKLALCGFTKLDPLFQKNNLIKQPDLELDTDKKTVLYTPTFYPSSIENTVQTLINISFDYNLIIKLHQFSWQLEKYIHHVKAIQELAKKENVYVLDDGEMNILGYYDIADLLLTDISSTMFEYLVLDRPIVQCLDMTFRRHHELLPWLANRRFDQERMEKVDFTYQVQSADDVNEMIKHALSVPGEMSEQRLKAINTFHYKTDGQASSRLVDIIEAKRMDSSK